MGAQQPLTSEGQANLHVRAEPSALDSFYLRYQNQEAKMRLLETAVHARPEGVLVDFLGEGGEKIAVTMAISDPGMGDAALIARARQMMVQLAAFEIAENEYDQQSNGNFDRLVVSGQLHGSG
ncbi:hypothetical protein LB579_30925 [Mesorhizobium sp. BR1-1-7]|uniref:hypothetical protein n=1 Tax=Mesorhizobium sp. BR1-1-7 TaxID=2876647 RepID=UPI001CCEAA18|nr:hypothetical protein [Mesorhizobium sp. BR1-1-7]MBZ9922107.1 hypothetical protein [Mesorhizobium sp. BR1-1-7]